MTDSFDTVKDALTLISDYGHEHDDYQMPPKEARRLARSALAALASIEAERDDYRARVDPFRSDPLVQALEAAERERDDLRQKRDNVGTLAVEEIIGRSKAEIRIAELERERDEALHAEEIAEQYREKAEARVVELEAELREIAEIS